MTWNRAWPVDVDGQVAQLVDDQQPGAAYRAQLRVEPAPMPSQTLGDKLRRVYDEIDEWRSRPLESEYPYVFVDGVWHKRSWGGSVENAGILVAIGVDPEGHREVIGVAEGMREDAAGWEQSVRGMIERGLKVVRLVVGDRCAGPVATVNPHAPRGEMPAVHGALHAQRAFEDAAKPQGLGFRGVEGRVRHGIPGDGPRQGRTGRRGDGRREAEGRGRLPARGGRRDDHVPAAGVPGRAPQEDTHQQHVLWAGFAGLAVLLGFGVVSPGSRRRAAGCWGRSPVGADIVVARWLHLPYGLLSCGQAGSVGCRSGGRPREAGVSWLVRGDAVGVPSGARRSRAA